MGPIELVHFRAIRFKFVQRNQTGLTRDALLCSIRDFSFPANRVLGLTSRGSLWAFWARTDEPGLLIGPVGHYYTDRTGILVSELVVSQNKNHDMTLKN